MNLTWLVPQPVIFPELLHKKSPHVLMMFFVLTRKIWQWCLRTHFMMGSQNEAMIERSPPFPSAILNDDPTVFELPETDTHDPSPFYSINVLTVYSNVASYSPFFDTFLQNSTTRFQKIQKHTNLQKLIVPFSSLFKTSLCVHSYTKAYLSSPGPMERHQPLLQRRRLIS